MPQGCKAAEINGGVEAVNNRCLVLSVAPVRQTATWCNFSTSSGEFSPQGIPTSDSRTLP